jgi:hypothetical protein
MARDVVTAAKARRPVGVSSVSQAIWCLKRVASYMMNEPAFCFTYGDGLSNLSIRWFSILSPRCLDLIEGDNSG